MKSRHFYPNGIISHDELKNFVEPAKMTINIPLRYCDSFTRNGSHILLSSIKEKYDELLKNMPTLKSAIPLFSKDHFGSISYTPHKDGYDFRIHPVDIVNNILEEFKIDKKLSFINLDDEDGKKYFVERVENIFETEKKTELDTRKKQIYDEIIGNITNILNMYDYTFEKEIEEYTVAKNLLFYIAYQSLINYKKTDEEVYTVIPYEYYNYVSTRNEPDWPCKIWLPGYFEKRWFGDFNSEYEKNIGRGFVPNPAYLNGGLTTRYLGWRILPEGQLHRYFNTQSGIIRTFDPKIREKNLKLFEMKVNYFNNSPAKAKIEGTYGLCGYIGFAYPNENLLFDKFYNNDTLPVMQRSILSHPEAIYALPSDELSLLRGDKQQIKTYLDDDLYSIHKINHTINGSFIDRMDKVVKAPVTSTKTFEEALEDENKQILIKGI